MNLSTLLAVASDRTARFLGMAGSSRRPAAGAPQPRPDAHTAAEDAVYNKLFPARPHRPKPVTNTAKPAPTPTTVTPDDVVYNRLFPRQH